MASAGTITRGDNESLTGTVLQSPGGSAKDITNALIVLKFTAKTSETSETILVQKTTTGGGIVKTVPASGQYRIDLLPADFITLNRAQSLQCDVEMTDTDGKIYTLVKFTLDLQLDITTS